MNSEQHAQLMEKYRYINVEHHDWWEQVYDDFMYDMEEVGIHVEKIYFTGFSSQGDGACFEGWLEDRRVYLDHHHKDQYPMIRKLLEHGGYVYAKCEQQGHYCHENCTSFWTGADTLIGMLPQPTEFHEKIARQWQIQLMDEMDSFEGDVIDQWRTYMRDLYRRLENEYDHLTSDEVVWETIKANELENAA